MPGALDTTAIFRALVANGLDLLRQSAKDLARNPKFSVAHFAAGVEILLKARLFREHWSLILTRPEKADLTRFVQGDIHSIAIGDALGRLADVVGESFTKEERAALEAVGRHRNQVLHFYHPKIARPEASALIAAEQSKAWFYLHRLLVGRWNAHFRGAKRTILGIDKAFRKNRHYLLGRFAAVSPELQGLGSTIRHCAICGYRSAEVESDGLALVTARCHVCEGKRTWLDASCPQCGEAVEFDDGVGVACSRCGELVELNDLGRPGQPFGMEGEGGEAVVYCMSCEYTPEPSVFAYREGLLCGVCFAHHDVIEQCPHCSEPLAGMDDEASTYLYGCLLCDGTWGKVKDE